MSQEIRKIKVKEHEIVLSIVNGEDYICLTDMAKSKGDNSRAADVIKNWIRNRATIEFLGIWEQYHNPDFKVVEFDHFRISAGLPSFVLSPGHWVEKTNAIGIYAKPGRYGGTFAHKDIAFEFGSAISPEFKLFLIKDYQRLKDWEQGEAKLEWDYRRFLSKVNYRLQTEAIEQHLIPLSTLPKSKESILYTQEADVVNVALFGMTAKRWRELNPEKALKGENVRDSASIIQLTVLANLENLNATMISDIVPQRQRLVALRRYASNQFKSLLKDPRLQRLVAEERKILGDPSDKNEPR
jgi:hypothetical protein